MSIWLLARSTGMVALIAFTAATALGALATLVPAGRDARALDRRYLLQMAHRSSAVLGLSMLAAHVLLILIDVYVNVSVLGALVPFTAGYRPLALGLGTLAVFTFVVVSVSGAVRGRLATSARAAKAWRVVHLTAYVGWALSMTHGVMAGTDTGATWSTAIYVVCGLAVAAAVTVRLRRTSPVPVTPRTLVRSSS